MDIPVRQVNFFIKAWNLVDSYSLWPRTFSEMDPSQKHLVVAMATILLSAITKLCVLCHISWTKHNTEKVMSTPVLMVKYNNDATYKVQVQFRWKVKGVIWCDLLFSFSLVCYVDVCACLRSAELQSSKSATIGFILSKREGWSRPG